jgi:hypothetical protein
MGDHVARRTCAACRAEADRSELLRLVLDPDGILVVDLKGTLPGRGAWVHPTTECVGALEREPRKLGHALKAPVATAGLLGQVRDCLFASVLGQLSLAAAAGALIGGHDAVEFAIRDGRVAELLFAADASDRTREDLTRGCELPVTILTIDKETLGARIGQPPRAVVGVVASPAFRHLREQLRRLRRLG